MLMSTQSVGDRWSTCFSHARIPIAVFKNLQLLHVLHFKLSCFLDLRFQRQSSASVSELLITVGIVRERQQLRLLQSRPSLHCCECQLSISSHHSLCFAASPRLACSVAKHAVSLPLTVEDTFRKISLCRSTTGCDRVHQKSVCSRPPRCTHHSS